MRSQNVAGNVGADLIIVGKSKSEQVGLSSRRFLSADEWENGLAKLPDVLVSSVPTTFAHSTSDFEFFLRQTVQCEQE
jgi:hypothetical protein